MSFSRKSIHNAMVFRHVPFIKSVYSCRLPVDDASGQELVAEGSASKKKDAVVACAYEACRIIDAHGMLRNANHGESSL